VDSTRTIGRATALAAIVVWLALQSISLASAASASKKLVLTGTVTAILQVEAPPPSRRNWAVTMRVEKVKRGKCAESEFTFAIHSPSLSGLEVGHRYTIEANWNGHGNLVDETVIKEEPSKP
jgi:hypothetical protein